MYEPTECTSVAVLRVWYEDPRPTGFRARVTLVDDVTEPATEVRYCTTPDEVLEVVGAFLGCAEADAAR
jgi:hypothetical protein